MGLRSNPSIKRSTDSLYAGENTMEKINLNIFTRSALEKWLDLWEQAEEIAQIVVQDMHDDEYGDDDYDDDSLSDEELWSEQPYPDYDLDDEDTTYDNDEAANDSDPLDACPFCQGPITPGQAAYGMCDACAHEQDGGES